MKTKETNFSEELFKVADKAHRFISDNTPINKVFKLISEKEIKNSSDEFYELPVATIVGKYGDYNEYAIVNIRHKKDGNIELNGVGRGENSGEEHTFNLNELLSDDICYLADTLSRKLK